MVTFVHVDDDGDLEFIVQIPPLRIKIRLKSTNVEIISMNEKDAPFYLYKRQLYLSYLQIPYWVKNARAFNCNNSKYSVRQKISHVK